MRRMVVVVVVVMMGGAGAGSAVTGPAYESRTAAGCDFRSICRRPKGAVGEAVLSASVEAVIFDVDGTLVDSERDGHRVAFNLAFEEHGLPYRWDIEPYGRLLETTGGRHRLHRYLAEEGVSQEQRDELVPSLHTRKTELFRELVTGGRVQARPGVDKLLDELENAEVRLAVATTGSRDWVQPLLDQLFGPGRFSPVVTGDDVSVRKPDPSAYLQALAGLELPPARALAVEDSANGLVAARNAGLACVVVVNDYTAEQTFDGAAMVVDSFGDLDVATLRGVVAGGSRT